MPLLPGFSLSVQAGKGLRVLTNQEPSLGLGSTPEILRLVGWENPDESWVCPEERGLNAGEEAPCPPPLWLELGA